MKRRRSSIPPDAGERITEEEVSEDNTLERTKPDEPEVNANTSLVQYNSESDEGEEEKANENEWEDQYNMFMEELGEIEPNNPADIKPDPTTSENENIQYSDTLSSETIESWRTWFTQWNSSTFSRWIEANVAVLDPNLVSESSDVDLRVVPVLPEKSKVAQFLAATNLRPDRYSPLHQRYTNIYACLWLLVMMPEIPNDRIFQSTLAILSNEERSHIAEVQASLAPRYHDWSIGALDTKYFEEIIVYWEKILAQLRGRFDGWNDYYLQLYEAGVFNYSTEDTNTTPADERRNTNRSSKVPRASESTDSVHPSRLKFISSDKSWNSDVVEGTEKKPATMPKKLVRQQLLFLV
ncbi:hypothetical protein HK098_004464 [Nowakowskiella sp. JEL0407]|nr:hypothetical protein HK098_004464 [Nowakowskiella sp. JEL0407]